MVEIEGFALRAAILHECQNYLKIKMHTINDKTRYISTISRKNKGLWTVYDKDNDDDDEDHDDEPTEDNN